MIGPAVDVHSAQWGTLPRLVSASRSGRVPKGIGIDEDSAVIDGLVAGNGSVYAVLPAPGAAPAVTRFTEGQRLPEEIWP